MLPSSFASEERNLLLQRAERLRVPPLRRRMRQLWRCLALRGRAQLADEDEYFNFSLRHNWISAAGCCFYISLSASEGKRMPVKLFTISFPLSLSPVVITSYLINFNYIAGMTTLNAFKQKKFIFKFLLTASWNLCSCNIQAALQFWHNFPSNFSQTRVCKSKYFHSQIVAPSTRDPRISQPWTHRSTLHISALGAIVHIHLKVKRKSTFKA